MSTVTQTQMTEEGIKEMFVVWANNAPSQPKKGWFGSLKSTSENGSYYYSCIIEEYDEDGFSVPIGKSTFAFPSGKYEEIYF